MGNKNSGCRAIMPALKALRPMPSYITPWYFSYLLCKMGLVALVLGSQTLKWVDESVYTKHLVQGLAQSKRLNEYELFISGAD